MDTNYINSNYINSDTNHSLGGDTGKAWWLHRATMPSLYVAARVIGKF